MPLSHPHSSPFELGSFRLQFPDQFLQSSCLGFRMPCCETRVYILQMSPPFSDNKEHTVQHILNGDILISVWPVFSSAVLKDCKIIFPQINPITWIMKSKRQNIVPAYLYSYGNCGYYSITLAFKKCTIKPTHRLLMLAMTTRNKGIYHDIIVQIMVFHICVLTSDGSMWKMGFVFCHHEIHFVPSPFAPTVKVCELIAWI